MSFIDEIYKETPEIRYPQNSLDQLDFHIIKSIIESVKIEIEKKKKERFVEGYIYCDINQKDNITEITTGIDQMSKTKYKKYSVERLTENRIPYLKKIDRLNNNLNAVLSLYGEYTFSEFPKPFLSELEKELYKLGLSKVKLKIEEVPAEFIVLKTSLLSKSYKASYYTNNKPNKVLKVQLEW